MLAWHRDGELVYAGNVGSGLDDATIEQLLERLDGARVDGPAFAGAPEPGARGSVYTRPELVCDVR